MVHYQKCLKVCKAIGDDDGIAIAKSNIANAKSKHEGGRNNEEVLKASQEVYELRVTTDGEEDAVTIHAGKKYAIDLHQNADEVACHKQASPWSSPQYDQGD